MSGLIVLYLSSKNINTILDLSSNGANALINQTLIVSLGDKNAFQLIEKTDLTRLSAGVYYIKLILENLAGEKIKSGAFKIIKERK